LYIFSGIIEVTSDTDELIYFRAPAKFLGDKRTAYQHKLTFYLREENADDPLDAVQGDVILKGKWFPENLVHKFDKRPGEEFSEFSVSIFSGISSYGGGSIWLVKFRWLGQKNICGFPVSRPYLAFGRRNPDPKLFYWIMLVSVST
jgi:hypothetical protein